MSEAIIMTKEFYSNPRVREVLKGVTIRVEESEWFTDEGMKPILYVYVPKEKYVEVCEKLRKIIEGGSHEG